MEPLLRKGRDFVVVQGAGNGNAGYTAVDAINTGLFASLTDATITLPTNTPIRKQDLLERVIIVGAAQKNKDGIFQQISYSNWGDQVSICAPGYNYYGLTLHDKYSYHEGTSIASPVVAGVCALVWSVEGNTFNGADVKDIVCNPRNTSYEVKDNSTWTHHPKTSKRLVNAKLALADALRRTPRTAPEENHALFEKAKEGIKQTQPMATRPPQTTDGEQVLREILTTGYWEWFDDKDGTAFRYKFNADGSMYDGSSSDRYEIRSSTEVAIIDPEYNYEMLYSYDKNTDTLYRWYSEEWWDDGVEDKITVFHRAGTAQSEIIENNLDNLWEDEIIEANPSNDIIGDWYCGDGLKISFYRDGTAEETWNIGTAQEKTYSAIYVIRSDKTLVLTANIDPENPEVHTWNNTEERNAWTWWISGNTMVIGNSIYMRG